MELLDDLCSLGVAAAAAAAACRRFSSFILTYFVTRTYLDPAAGGFMSKQQNWAFVDRNLAPGELNSIAPLARFLVVERAQPL